MSVKKYKKGKQIKTLDELFSHDVVYVINWDKAHNTAFFRSWPYFLIKNWMDTKRFYTAIAMGPTGINYRTCENCLCVISSRKKICPLCGAKQ